MRVTSENIVFRVVILRKLNRQKKKNYNIITMTIAMFYIRFVKKCVPYVLKNSFRTLIFILTCMCLIRHINK